MRLRRAEVEIWMCGYNLGVKSLVPIWMNLGFGRDIACAAL